MPWLIFGRPRIFDLFTVFVIKRGRGVTGEDLGITQSGITRSPISAELEQAVKNNRKFKELERVLMNLKSACGPAK